jgi:hypothetical protein
MTDYYSTEMYVKNHTEDTLREIEQDRRVKEAKKSKQTVKITNRKAKTTYRRIFGFFAQ